MANVTTKESLIAAIAKCDSIISKQSEKKRKLESKLADIRQTELLNAILKSGKSLEEILEYVNN